MQIPLSYSEQREALKAGTLSCTALVNHYLQQISARNTELNAFIEVYAEEALAQAQAQDQQIAEGKMGRLSGMVIGLKDNLCYKGHPATAGSKILTGFKSLFTAPSIERLLNEGAIVIGRQNCDEFGMGSSNENSYYGPVKNAADPKRVPGGSSGGSAVAVQAEMCVASLGTDTGGSVRLPAAFCGLYGIKPTYGRISRYGLIAYASSFDCLGFLTHTAEDAALLLEISAGEDGLDSTASKQVVPAYTEGLSLSGKKKIAVLKEGLESESIAPSIRKALRDTMATLKAEGHEVEVVSFPYLEYLLPTYYILTTAEASSNLQRYDGVRYGYRSPEAHNLETLYKNTRGEGFGTEVKRRIILGTFVLSASYYDAYFTKAQKVRRLLKEETEKILQKADFLLTPTSANTAFRFGEKSNDPLAMFLTDVFTVQANVVGLPAMAFPAGKDEEQMPIGLQLMAKPFQEGELLALAKFLGKK